MSSFPPTADSLLLDTYLTNEAAASARVFRVYPPHATALPRKVRRISLRALRPRHVLDGHARQRGRIRPRRPAFLQAHHRPRAAGHPRGAGRLSLPSTRPAASLPTSSSSIPPTARPSSSSGRRREPVTRALRARVMAESFNHRGHKVHKGIIPRPSVIFVFFVVNFCS